MKKIGLFYGGTTAKTAVVALKIQEAFTENEVVLIPIEGATRKEFESFDNIIAGTSTWFRRRTADLLGRVHAGNRIHRHDGQESRTIRARRPRTLSQQFRYGIGILAEAFTKSNAELIGFMPVSAITTSPNHGPSRKDISWDFPSISRTSPNKRRNGY